MPKPPKTAKVPHLLSERGRYYYQRKVPLNAQDAVGFKKWREPVGADIGPAIDRVRELTKEHNDLLQRLENPEDRRDFKTNQRRQRERETAELYAAQDAAYRKWLIENDLSDPGHFGEDPVSIAIVEEMRARPWESANRFMEGLEAERIVEPDIQFFQALIADMEAEEVIRVRHTVPPFPEYRALVDAASVRVQENIEFLPRMPDPMDDDEYHDVLVEILNSHFGEDVTPPKDPDDRDEFDLAKQRLERKIARVARSPDTITKVAERYYRFAQIREKTQDKYRRTIKRLVSEVGDLPIQHLTASTLREYRDKLTKRGNLPASIRADFTPIIGLLGYAVDESLIDISPMAGVKLPKEKRSVEESKWLPFEPSEMQRVLTAVEDVWGSPLQGLTADRRQALQMVVRVLAFSAMRPAEIMALTPAQVDDKAIRVEGGKTKSAWRVIPLHPEIADFPAWLHDGGMQAFANLETGEQQTDPVTPVRHNFARLIREILDPPISEPRKALYSLRSTFQNALRRAGAPIDVRRAILGHVEAGAIRHYDDGPEFELLRHWVNLADPRR